VDVTVQPDGAYTVGSPAAATVTIADNDRPTVTIVATDPTASDTARDTGTFTISRTGPTTAPLLVTFTVTGTATGGADYPALGTSLTMPADASTVTLTVTPVADGVSEPNETVEVFLTANPSVRVGTPGWATVTIVGP
jgi:hypothetical protein